MGTDSGQVAGAALVRNPWLPAPSMLPWQRSRRRLGGGSGVLWMASHPTDVCLREVALVCPRVCPWPFWPVLISGLLGGEKALGTWRGAAPGSVPPSTQGRGLVGTDGLGMRGRGKASDPALQRSLLGPPLFSLWAPPPRPSLQAFAFASSPSAPSRQPSGSPGARQAPASPSWCTWHAVAGAASPLSLAIPAATRVPALRLRQALVTSPPSPSWVPCATWASP